MYRTPKLARLQAEADALRGLLTPVVAEPFAATPPRTPERLRLVLKHLIEASAFVAPRRGSWFDTFKQHLIRSGVWPEPATTNEEQEEQSA